MTKRRLPQGRRSSSVGVVARSDGAHRDRLVPPRFAGKRGDVRPIVAGPAGRRPRAPRSTRDPACAARHAGAADRRGRDVEADGWVDLVTWRDGLESTTEDHLHDVYRQAIGTHSRLFVARIDGTRPVRRPRVLRRHTAQGCGPNQQPCLSDRIRSCQPVSTEASTPRARHVGTDSCRPDPHRDDSGLLIGWSHDRKVLHTGFDDGRVSPRPSSRDADGAL